MKVEVNSMFQIGDTVKVQFRNKPVIGKVDTIEFRVNKHGVDPDMEYLNYLIEAPNFRKSWHNENENGVKWFKGYDVHKTDCMFDPKKGTCSCYPEETR